jgi:hypothetical protein
MIKSYVRTTDEGGSSGLVGMGTHVTCANRCKHSKTVVRIFDIEAIVLDLLQYANSSQKVEEWLLSRSPAPNCTTCLHETELSLDSSSTEAGNSGCTFLSYILINNYILTHVINYQLCTETGYNFLLF